MKSCTYIELLYIVYIFHKGNNMNYPNYLIFVLLVWFSCGSAFGHLEELFWWTTLDYEYKSEEARNQSIESKEFVPENNVPFGVEVWRDKIFVTVPRRKPGVPSTLNFINLEDSPSTSPQLKPYPDWNANNLSSRFLISTYRVNADKCDRLWSVDTGSVMDFEGRGERFSAPRIRIFDLIDNSPQAEYVLKPEDYGCDASYVSIAVDVGESCQDAHAYLVDPGSNSLLVYSLSMNESWRISHPYFLPDPMQTEYQINDLEFMWNDGLFGFALGERLRKNSRTVYFHPMSSLLEFTTTTDVFQNHTATSEYRKHTPVIKILGSRERTFQAAASAFDERNGILFYSLVSKNAIGCWSSKKFDTFRHDTTDIVATDDVAMIYFSDLKVDKDSNLWAISNRLPIILYGSFDPKDINFRIFTAPVRTAIRGTLCESSRTRPFWYRTANERN